MTPFIKICGVTRPEDALLAVSLGATHIGVVRTETSPRWAPPEQARAVFDSVAGKTETVYVFKDIPISQAISDAKFARAMNIQLYNATDKDVALATSEGFCVYRAYLMGTKEKSLPVLNPAPSVDSPAIIDVGSGGSGKQFDWKLLGEHAPDATFIAGGVHAGNVHELLKYQPYGIDLASGIESSPGFKSEMKLQKFFKEVLKL